MRIPYTRLNTSRPVFSLGGVLWRDYPLCMTGVQSEATSTSVDALIDSGSDDIVLPITVSRKLGLDLSKTPQGHAQAVGGQSIGYHYVRLTLRLSDGVEHCEWDAMVGITTQPLRWALFGRSGFFRFFDVNFQEATRETVVVPNANFPGRYSHP